jgi:hypothetical protein
MHDSGKVANGTYYNGSNVDRHEYKVGFRTNILHGNWPGLSHDDGTDGASACRNIEAFGADIGWEDLRKGCVSFTSASLIREGIPQFRKPKHLAQILWNSQRRRRK